MGKANARAAERISAIANAEGELPQMRDLMKWSRNMNGRGEKKRLLASVQYTVSGINCTFVHFAFITVAPAAPCNSTRSLPPPMAIIQIFVSTVMCSNAIISARIYLPQLPYCLNVSPSSLSFIQNVQHRHIWLISIMMVIIFSINSIIIL